MRTDEGEEIPELAHGYKCLKPIVLVISRGASRYTTAAEGIKYDVLSSI